MKRHFDNIVKKAGRAIGHWWLMLLAGLLCIAAGICVFAFPLESYVTLAILFGVLMLVTGAVQLIVASTSGNYLMMKGYVVIGGVLDLILGIFLCIYPGITLVLLPVMMGLWMLYHSFMIISFGGDMDTFRIPGNGWIICSGIILLLLSIFVLLNPMSFGIATVIILAGVGLLLFGLIMIIMSTTLKNIHKYLEAE